MSIVYLFNARDVQRITPERVLTDIGTERRLNNVVVKGQHFAALLERIVAVCVLKGIDSVLAGCDAADDKMSP